MNSKPAPSILNNLRDISSGSVNLVRTSKQKKDLIKIVVLMAGLVSGLILVQRVQELREKALVGGPDLFFANSPFSLQPSTTNNVYEIFMNTNGFEVTAAVIEVQPDTNLIQITSISKGTALTDVLIPGTVSGNRANITLGSGPTTPFNGTGKVATLTFNTGAQSGQTNITFTQNTQIAAIGNTGDVLGTTSPGRVIIGSTSTPTTTPTPTSPPPSDNPPTCRMISCPASGVVNQSVSFSATASDPDGNLSEVEMWSSPVSNEIWSNVADNCPGPDCLGSQSFANTGDYYVVCNAKDSAGNTCTGNPFRLPPGENDCGTEDACTISISTTLPTSAPSPTPTPSVLPPPSTDAIAHWKFDEGSGFSAIDSSGNNNTGTISGATWTSFGRFNKALVFEDGVGDQVLVKTNLMSSLAGTISAWARAEEFEPVPQYIFGHTTFPAAANRLQIYTDDTSGQLDIGVGDNHTAAVGVFDLNVKQWYHVALTWDSGTFKVYVNGTLVHTGSYSGLTTLDSTAAIGNAWPGHPTQSWNGTIDEINIFNRELSSGEIASLADVGTGTPTPTLTGPTPTPSPLTGDINGDGGVNILDFQILNNNFGTSNPDSDLNEDGIVNILDFQILSNNFG